ncbi:hypothetical protein SELR_pSRC200520 (plasmid) [Selenomonas ruminantium subsp. lactilytica TAM6421]|uniref:Uncharacterized protein n=1 Tax=Selenomonas ruminantium subsp. lactilytica (strain NBRC 103574 / TAM6421) TaxID=927704 RepID=I0GUZ9_SELRL|nr:hypothetical protein [Selenomonas ruminantium]BAL84586.1 hypothetical protein SELR_pSRC200520 [Selenomonas ruminantium subsp. lactilytica TAM6421]
MCQKGEFYKELAIYVYEKFGLTKDDILAMGEEELNTLYEKACDNETDEVCRCEDIDYGDNKELKLAEDFSDWLADL